MKAKVALSTVVLLGMLAGMWGSVAAAGLYSLVAAPFISQYQGQTTQNSDCGPASGAMVLQAYGKRPGGLTNKEWVVQVRSHSGNSSGYLTFPQLEAALRWYGVSASEISPSLLPAPDAQMQKMKNALAANQLVIALVHGATLGRGTSYGDHFIVVRGFSDDGQRVYVNDPDNRCLSGWLECGGQTSWSYARFRLACYQAQTGPYGIIVVNGGVVPSGYTFCSKEGQRCSFSGTKDVAYGANGKFYYKYGVANGIDCNNAVFGDPIYGVAKACYIKDKPIGPPGYTFCSNEGQRCGFTGTQDVAYGANGKFSHKLGVTGGIDCNNNTFGDPIPGIFKACYVHTPTPSNVANFVAVHSGKCMDVSGGSRENGAAIIQWDCHGGDNQQWNLVPVGSYYKLIARHSGKCLDVSGGSYDSGANIIQWDCHGGDNQLWRLEPTGSYYRLVAKHSGKCLDVSGGSYDNGARLIQWDCHGSNNQLWAKRIP